MSMGWNLIFGPFTRKEYDRTLYGQKILRFSEAFYEKVPVFREQE
jgi:hypothetical protein